ncbi:MAG: hypothetical protein ACK44A_09995, partial [Roseateles sp.]
MALALLKPPLDEWQLPAGHALAFVDAASGEAVTRGLHCSLVLRRTGQPLGQARATPSGILHFPELPERWRDPLPPALADVVVRDELARSYRSLPSLAEDLRRYAEAALARDPKVAGSRTLGLVSREQAA